jgi:hypothetical protein
MAVHDQKFAKLMAFLRQVPAITRNDTPPEAFGSGDLDNGGGWVKFIINIEHPLAWNVVQEFGHGLNYLSPNERLPTIFKPVSLATVSQWRASRVMVHRM